LIVPLIVVLDTNVLFSAAGWRGNAFECVEQARTGKVVAVTCLELLEELAEKLESKLGFSSEQSAETLADYLSFLRIVSIPRVLKAVPRDPDDDAVLECALESKAEFVVSGDMDLLELKEFEGIKILRPREFLAVLQNRSS
jgi:putative PIN family toxin of toxin-antitoxin system